MYFPDFDYVNPETKQRHGESSRDRIIREAKFISTQRSISKMTNTFKGKRGSMKDGRVYESQDIGSFMGRKMPAIAGAKR